MRDLRLYFRKKKSLDQDAKNGSRLLHCLSAFDLTLFGIGAIIGAGIFVLTGIAAAQYAGPGIVLSYIIAGCACAFSALAYAELSASIGGCGSAYGYAYIALGEIIAWMIGWDLLLEYAISVSTVSIGWSHYLANLFSYFSYEIPPYLLKSFLEGGLIDLPAVLIVLGVSILLMIGVKTSARFNAIMVFIKLSVIALFIVLASFHVNFTNWTPFLPYGWHGVMSGAALIFFAYIGFDAVSTAAEEVLEPQRDLPIGIILSLIICTLVYIIVSGLLTSILPYSALNVGSPIAYALMTLGYHFASAVIALGAIAGLTTVILVMYYGLSRVFLAMSRDQLLPPYFSHLNQKTHTPVRIIAFTGILIAAFSGCVPMNDLAELVNIGTLFAFILVSMGVIVLRITQPDRIRPFRTPYSPLIPLLGIAFCIYLIASLPFITFIRFVIWMSLGFCFYFFYGFSKSRLNTRIISETNAD